MTRDQALDALHAWAARQHEQDLEKFQRAAIADGCSPAEIDALVEEARRRYFQWRETALAKAETWVRTAGTAGAAT